jgi:hypothetical protein
MGGGLEQKQEQQEQVLLHSHILWQLWFCLGKKKKKKKKKWCKHWLACFPLAFSFLAHYLRLTDSQQTDENQNPKAVHLVEREGRKEGRKEAGWLLCCCCCSSEKEIMEKLVHGDHGWCNPHKWHDERGQEASNCTAQYWHIQTDRKQARKTYCCVLVSATTGKDRRRRKKSG